MRCAFVILCVLVAGLNSARAQIDCVGPMPGPCSLLHQAKAIFVGTVIEVNETSLQKRFRVTEAFKGVKSGYVEVIDVPGGTRHFKLGEPYLVFATSCYWAGAPKGCLATIVCSHSRNLKYAEALVGQLRAEKNGARVAAVYGTLRHRLGSGEETVTGDYWRPMPHVVVRLRADKKSYETRTDESGVYAFHRIPPGKYQISADLQPNMELGEQAGNGPVPSIELPRRSCFENDLYALPTGRITGRIIGPDGKQLRSANAELYTLSQYREGRPGLQVFQGEGRPLQKWKPFQFFHLPAGDYVLVFNSADKQYPDAPFPRTFYPHASDVESAEVIHLAEGQQILNADIQVSNPFPTREITLRLAWNGRRPKDYYSPQVFAAASKGMDPYPFQEGQDTYSLHVLLNAQYAIRAEAFCQMGTTGKTETSAITIDASDQLVSEATLTFDKGECVRK